MRQVNLAEFEPSARKALPKFIFDYVAGGAEDERTLAANHDDFSRITFRPRVLVDVTGCSTATSVFGDEIALPVLLAPTGINRAVHKHGELAVARAAGRQGTIFTVSAAASYTIEEVAATASKPLWFQLYAFGGRELMAPLVQRAQAAGYRALCFTVDTAVTGKRERDLRNGLTLPPRISPSLVLASLRRPRWLVDYLLSPPITLRNMEQKAQAAPPRRHVSLVPAINNQLVSGARTWEDIAWLRDQWRGPLLLKGVQTGEDTQRAIGYGVDGIIVSNHGGRQLDGAPSTISSLAEVVKAANGRAEVFLDGGIRRGADVVKAIALGARACLIGRPYVYGLACGGEKGVERVLEILRGEIMVTLMLLGRCSVAEIDRSAVQLAGEAVTSPAV